MHSHDKSAWGADQEQAQKWVGSESDTDKPGELSNSKADEATKISIQAKADSETLGEWETDFEYSLVSTWKSTEPPTLAQWMHDSNNSDTEDQKWEVDTSGVEQNMYKEDMDTSMWTEDSGNEDSDGDSEARGNEQAFEISD